MSFFFGNDQQFRARDYNEDFLSVTLRNILEIFRGKSQCFLFQLMVSKILPKHRFSNIEVPKFRAM